jgi:hypothetical protein
MDERADVTMRDEYDFTGAIRANYAERYDRESNIFAVDPQVGPVPPVMDSASAGDEVE